MSQAETNLLDIKNLTIDFFSGSDPLRAVDNVSFEVKRGEIFGIVGESGCGKSVSCLSILRLISSPPGKIHPESGIFFDSNNLLTLSDKAIRKIRGNRISMIFQEPMTSLNPVFTIGNQIVESILLHQEGTKKEACQKAVEMLQLVGISSPEKRVHEYPHQLSGGMRQRAMIAMALSCNPDLLIADEPTTALDVTVQAQILDLLLRLKEEMGMSIILVTHALGVIAEVADRMMVMYCGKIVEKGSVQSVFTNPKHPYTVGLLNSLPRLDRLKRNGTKERLAEIPGMVPNQFELPEGCSFMPRCGVRAKECEKQTPARKDLEDGHFYHCIH